MCVYPAPSFVVWLSGWCTSCLSTYNFLKGLMTFNSEYYWAALHGRNLHFGSSNLSKPFGTLWILLKTIR